MAEKRGFNMLTVMKEYSLITVGCVMYVIGWLVFLVPCNLIGGGVTGMSSIIQYATNGAIPMGYSYFVINVFLLILSMVVLGKGFGFKTIYAIILSSVMLNVGQELIPESIIESLAYENGNLICVIMGGILSGIGVGISMDQGGSTGGTDIIALIINKYRNMPPGKIILMLDVFIVSSSLLFPSYTGSGELVPMMTKITNVMYGMVLTFVLGNVVDLYISGSRQSTQVFIISKKYEEIADCVVNELDRGVTALDGQGWYTKAESKVLLVIVRRADLKMVLRAVKSIDPDAFLSVSSATAVYGQGFDTIKGSKPKKIQ